MNCSHKHPEILILIWIRRYCGFKHRASWIFYEAALHSVYDSLPSFVLDSSSPLVICLQDEYNSEYLPGRLKTRGSTQVPRFYWSLGLLVFIGAMSLKTKRSQNDRSPPAPRNISEVRLKATWLWSFSDFPDNAPHPSVIQCGGFQCWIRSWLNLGETCGMPDKGRDKSLF